MTLHNVPSGEGRSALVVGGTGPTGPDVVQGLVERGYTTTIFHGGKHEIALPPEIAHIHGDPHFPETIASALDGRTFDVVIAQYGRLRHLVDYFQERTGHIVAIGGMVGPLLPPTDPRWGPMGRPAILREEDRRLQESLEDGDKLGFRIAQAARRLFAAGAQSGVKTTYIVYPVLYGPRQPGSPEWSIVRRLRDGRRSLILPDGGLKIDSRGYVRNVAQAPLLALDKPEVSDGKSYVVTDRDLYTVRQRVEFIAQHMGAELDVVSMAFDVATPAHPLYRHGPEHRAGLADSIRDDLGYVDTFAADEALAETVDWLLASPEAVAEIEKQLNDPFDYQFEDELIQWWRRSQAGAPRPDQDYNYSHIYRHPKNVGEDWRRV